LTRGKKKAGTRGEEGEKRKVSEVNPLVGASHLIATSPDKNNGGYQLINHGASCISSLFTLHAAIEAIGSSSQRIQSKD
jgi:hypothetical protein